LNHAVDRITREGPQASASVIEADHPQSP